jgi:hypothetical protein
MSTTPRPSPARLRGALTFDSLGARGLERAARNPECLRLQALTLAGLSPTRALKDIYRETVTVEGSPFALVKGRQFEKAFFADDATALRALYEAEGALPSSGCSVVDLSVQFPKASPESLARRREATTAFVRRLLAGDRGVPRVIIKPRFAVDLLGQEHGIEPDALVLREGEGFYRVIEVKSYPDREGKTSTTDLRDACRQSAVGVVAMRHVLRALGRDDAERLAPAWADLVLAHRASLRGRLRAMPIEGEVGSIERLVNEAPDRLAEVFERVGPEAALDAPGVLETIPNHYRGRCREHCALAAHCRAAASATADPCLLGDAARERLLPIGSLARAVDLLRKRSKPRDAEEAALVGQLELAYQSWKRAVNDG